MEQREVNFFSNGQQVVGDLFTPENPRGAVLIIHGSSEKGRAYGARRNNYERAEAIVKAGCAALAFDLRGYGDSEGDLGNLSIKDHLDDVLAAFFFLHNLYPKVHILGGSYGGYLAVIALEKLNPESLLLRAPAIYDDELFSIKGTNAQERMQYRLHGDFSGSRAVECITKYQNPLYIIGSELDECVPKRVLDAYFDSASSNNKKIDWLIGATHAPKDLKTQIRYQDLITEWYKSL